MGCVCDNNYQWESNHSTLPEHVHLVSGADMWGTTYIRPMLWHGVRDMTRKCVPHTHVLCCGMRVRDMTRKCVPSPPTSRGDKADGGDMSC